MDKETKNTNRFYKLASAFFEKYENDQQDGDYGVDANNPDQLVVYANWNIVPNARKWEDLFEKLGAEIGWCDEYVRCDDCGHLIDTHPTSYGWQPDYIIHEFGYTCRKCVEDNPKGLEEFFDEYIGTYHHPVTRKAIPDWAIQLFEDAGWECWSEDNAELCARYENGFHPGQNDDPEKIFKEIMNVDNTLRVVFAIDAVGQFDINFHVLVKPEIEDD